MLGISTLKQIYSNKEDRKAFMKGLNKGYFFGCLIGLFIINVAIIGFVSMPFWVSFLFKLLFVGMIAMVVVSRVNRKNIKIIYNELYENLW